jgi:uncharacterized integral membrane protein
VHRAGDDDRGREPGQDQPTEEPRGHAPHPERARTAKIVLGLILLILLLIFVIQNSKAVRVHLVFTEVQVALVWVFLACALLGAAIALLLGRPYRRAMKKYVRELERERDTPRQD